MLPPFGPRDILYPERKVVNVFKNGRVEIYSQAENFLPHTPDHNRVLITAARLTMDPRPTSPPTF